MTAAHIVKAAAARGFDPRVVSVIVEVESGPEGAFGSDGWPIILYEPHVAWRVAPPAIRRILADAGLAYQRWGEQPYPRTQAARWEQFTRCVDLAGRDVAIQACSWGLGQVLGENWRLCGFPSPAVFEAAQATEVGQVETMLRFLEGHDLAGAINGRDWRRIARIYNGPGQVDRYAALMEAAWRRQAGDASPVVLRIGAGGPAVRELQKALGEDPDGHFGSHTEAAVMAFQRERGLVVDGVVGARTWAALRENGVKPQTQPVPTPALDIAATAGKVTATAGAVTAAAKGLAEATEATRRLADGVPTELLAAGAGGALLAGLVLWGLPALRRLRPERVS